MSDDKFRVPIKPSDTFYEKLKEAMARIHPAFENVGVSPFRRLRLEARHPDPLKFWLESLRLDFNDMKSLMEFMVNHPYSVATIKYLTNGFTKVFERPSLDHVIRPLAVEVAVNALKLSKSSSVEDFLKFINSEIGINANSKNDVEDLLHVPIRVYSYYFLEPKSWCVVSIASHACVNRGFSSDEIIEKSEILSYNYTEETLRCEVEMVVKEGTEMAIEILKKKMIKESDNDVYSKYLEVFKDTVTIALQCFVELIENPERVAERCLSVDPVISIEGVTIGPEDYDPEWSRVQRIEREIPSAEEITHEILDAVMNTISSAKRMLEARNEGSEHGRKEGSNAETSYDSDLWNFVEDFVREILGSRRKSRR